MNCIALSYAEILALFQLQRWLCLSCQKQLILAVEWANKFECYFGHYTLSPNSLNIVRKKLNLLLSRDYWHDVPSKKVQLYCVLFGIIYYFIFAFTSWHTAPMLNNQLPLFWFNPKWQGFAMYIWSFELPDYVVFAHLYQFTVVGRVNCFFFVIQLKSLKSRTSCKNPLKAKCLTVLVACRLT